MSNYDPITGKVGNIGPRTVQSVNIATNNGPIVGRVFNAANKQSIRLTGNNLSALIQQYRLNNIDIINFLQVVMRVTFTMDIDLLEYNRYFETKELDGDLMAIYDLIFTHSDRRWEKGEPDDIQIYFEEPPND